MLSQVSVAYDEYRVTVSESVPEPEINEQFASLDIEITDTIPLIKESVALQGRLDQEIETIKTHVEQEKEYSDEAIEFKESLEDTHNANLVVRGFLHGKRIVRRWYRASIDGLYASGKKVEKTGKVIKELGLPMAGLVFAKAPFAAPFVLVAIRDFGEKLINYGKHLDTRHKTLRNNKTVTKNDAIPELDDTLQKEFEQEAMLLLASGRTVPPDIAENVRYLTFGSHGSPLYELSSFDFESLRDFPYLEFLSFEVGFRDTIRLLNFEMIEIHKHLGGLKIPKTSFDNFSPLEKLKDLTFLDASDSFPTSFYGLGKLEQLNELNLEGTNIRSFEEIINLRNLVHLDLNSTQISELPSFTYFKHMENLDVGGTFIADLNELKRAEGMRELNLAATRISDIKALANLEKLESLDISGTMVTDLTPLSKLPNLKTLGVRSTGVNTTAALKGFSNLELLD